MTAPLVIDEPYVPSHRVGPNNIEEPEEPLRDRIERLEHDITEVRKAVSELAGIVVGEIKERRATTSGSESHFPHHFPNPTINSALQVAQQLNRPWLLLDLFREAYTALRMYFDPRYRIRRGTQLLVPGLLAMFAGAYVFFNYVFDIAIVSPVLERLVEILLAVMLYKVVQREVTRYRQCIAEYVAAGHATITLPSQIVNIDGEPPMERQGVE